MSRGRAAAAREYPVLGSTRRTAAREAATMVAVLLLLAALGGSEAQGAEPAAPAPSPRPAPRLRLGNFGLAALRPEPIPKATFEIPRFNTQLDVEGWTRRDPNQSIDLFVRTWKLDTS